MMRVSGGIGRGQKLRVPAGKRVRPTSDKVKQALFNILGEKVVGARFLDLFAGAGGIGIEAISRGAASVVFVDASRDSIQAIKDNVEKLGFSDRAKVVQATAATFLRRHTGLFDIIFLDPPYSEDAGPLLVMIGASRLLDQDGIVVYEHYRKKEPPGSAGGLLLFREARYGDTVLAFYRLSSQPMPASLK